MSKHKPKKRYDDEKMHFFRMFALLIIALAFFGAAGMSIFTLMKTKEIVQHPSVYRKQREYKCSVETDDREALQTGTRQLMTYDPDLFNRAKAFWSAELNVNPEFKKDNPNEPELPAGYRNVSVSGAQGIFLHDKVNDTLHIFANIPPDSQGQAGWFMDYFNVDDQKQYTFTTSYVLDKAKAVVVAEEVDADGKVTYSDLTILTPSNTQTTKTLLFLPHDGTVKLRFFSQLTSMGSMTIYKESIHTFNNLELDQPLLTVSFDDGWESVFEQGKPVLDKYGIKSTQNIIAESFRSLLSGYMSLSEVKQMQKAGHEIASHSLRHCNLARLSQEDIEYDVESSKSLLESEFGTIRGLAYPYGSYNNDVERVAAKTYDYTRTTETGYNGLLMNRSELRSVTVGPDMPFEDFKQIVDYAKRHKLWLNLVYHKVEANPDLYGISAAALDQQMGYITSSGMRVVTAAEAVDLIKAQQTKKLTR